MKKSCLILLLYAVLFLSATNLYSQWVQTGFPADSASNLWVSCLAAKEGNLFAGTWGDGVYRSTDGGGNWEEVNYGLSNVWVHALAVVPRPGGGTNLFAGVRGGVCRSTDDGTSCVSANSGFDPAIEVQALGVAGTTILAGCAQQGSISGVYRSVNDGGNWTLCNSGFATPADSNIYSFASITSGGQTYFYAGTGNGVFMSTSDGISWSPIRNGLPTEVVYSLIVNPGAGGLTGNTLFAGPRQHGAYRSTNNGSSWSACSDGLNATDVTAFAVSPVSGGTDRNIFAAAGYVDVSTNNGTQWWDTEWPYEEVGPAYCLTLNGDYLFAGVNFGYGGIWKYDLTADTGWVQQQSGTTDTLWTVKAVDNNVVWTGGTSGGVFRTTNGGTTWTSVGGGTIGSDVVYVVEAIDANTAFVSTYSSAARIFKTTNGGATWSAVFSQTGGLIGGIQMKTALEGYAVGTPVGGKWTVLKTSDGGNTWARTATEPPHVGTEEVTLAVQLLGNTIWFGTSENKVYRSTNLGATWSSVATHGSVVFGLHFNSAAVGMTGFLGGGSNRSTNGGASWDTAHAAGFKDVMCISGLGSEFWAITGSGIAYTNTDGQSWVNSSPGHWGGLVPLLAVSISPVASTVNGWAVGKSGMILHYRRHATGVAQGVAPLPASYMLEQNYPNPFNPTTAIRYQIPEASHVTLKVFDLLGREVAVLVNESHAAGSYAMEWNADGFASGVYYFQLRAGEFVQTKKLVLLR